MAVDDDRRRTAGQRRARLIESFTREFDTENPTSAASRFKTLVEDGTPRRMVVSGDIDGLVSAAMIARAAPLWRAVAMVIKSDKVLVHPDYVSQTLELATCVGVDVFSTYFPSISNHPVLWGSKRLASSADAGAAAEAYDGEVRRRSRSIVMANPSLWAGVEGSYPEAAAYPFAAGYRYPLGTAQVALALLEVIEKSPRLFDRDYLPWLVANCDGGLDTIRQYPHNVPLWWGCMAAAVGPASLSEHIYSLAMNQRATEFVDVVNRLRAEAHLLVESPAKHLDDKWNLRAPTRQGFAAITDWIVSLSGWPDPFLGGASGLAQWVEVPLAVKGAVYVSGLPVGATRDEQMDAYREGLRSSLKAFHTNFAYFDGAPRLNWVAPWPGALAPTMPPLPGPLHPGGLNP